MEVNGEYQENIDSPGSKVPVQFQELQVIMPARCGRDSRLVYRGKAGRREIGFVLEAIVHSAK
jgi:hypothetical protein